MYVHVSSGSGLDPTQTYNKVNMGGHECQRLFHGDFLDQLLTKEEANIAIRKCLRKEEAGFYVLYKNE